MTKEGKNRFHRFLYSDGSKASSEKKENIQGSKKNSTEAIGRDTYRSMDLRHETEGGC